MYVVLSLSLVLFLLGLVGLWTLQARQLTRQLQEDLDIIVELANEGPPGAPEELTRHLRAAPYVRAPETVRFLPKEDALAEMGEELQQDLDAVGMTNPLLDVIAFNVSLPYLETERLDSIATELQARPGVAGVYYQENFVDRIARNARRLSYLLLGLALLFTLVAALLIHNTVRLSLYANRFVIKTQELVGASWGFISRPYLWRAVGQGVVSGLLALGGLAAVHYWVRLAVPELQLGWDAQPLLYGAGGLVALGVVVNLLSHYVVVRRYLRLRVDELY